MTSNLHYGYVTLFAMVRSRTVKDDVTQERVDRVWIAWYRWLIHIILTWVANAFIFFVQNIPCGTGHHFVGHLLLYFESDNTCHSFLSQHSVYYAHWTWWIALHLRDVGIYWANEQLHSDVDFTKENIIFADEAHFRLDRYFNKQNCCIWEQHVILHKPVHPVWWFFGAACGARASLSAVFLWKWEQRNLSTPRTHIALW